MSQADPAPLGGDVDRGSPALIILWVLAGIAVIVVALRFLGRRMVRSMGSDDWIMLFTLGLYIIFAAILTKDISVGGMRHLYYLTPDERIQAGKWSWISQPFVIMGFATGKVSVGILLLRVIGSTSTFWRKWILCFAVVTAFLASAVNVILTFAQCSPAEALWNPQLVVEGKAKCWPPSIQTNFAIFVSSYNILTDTILALLPASFLYKLNLTWKKRIGLCVLLGLGLAAAVFAAVKTKYLGSLNERSDITWETYELFIWSGAELFVIIFCGSVPGIKPVYDHFFGKPKVSTANATGYSGFPSSSSYLRGGSKTRPAETFNSREDEELELYPPGVGSDVISAQSTSHSLHSLGGSTYSPPENKTTF